MNINFPLQMDGHGRTATADADTHIRQMIEEVLFTSPGERVNRPNFGSGLLQLVFAPGSEELVAATQFLVQGALQQWMGDLILIDSVQVQSEDSAIRVTVRYVVRRNQQSKVVELVRPVS
jgi:phage baseplate assembly protein W